MLIPIHVPTPPAIIAPTANARDTTDKSVYTFTGQSFGAEASNRIIAVAVGAINVSGSAYSFSGVTIGGVSATEAVFIQHISTNSVLCGIYYATVPAGTTGTIEVTATTTLEGCGIMVYQITGASSVSSTDTDTATNPLTCNVTAQNGSVSIGAAVEYASATSWTMGGGLTQYATVDVNAGEYFTSGYSSNEGSLALTATGSAYTTGPFAMVAAVFTP